MDLFQKSGYPGAFPRHDPVRPVRLGVHDDCALYTSVRPTLPFLMGGILENLLLPFANHHRAFNISAYLVEPDLLDEIYEEARNAGRVLTNHIHPYYASHIGYENKELYEKYPYRMLNDNDVRALALLRAPAFHRHIALWRDQGLDFRLGDAAHTFALMYEIFLAFAQVRYGLNLRSYSELFKHIAATVYYPLQQYVNHAHHYKTRRTLRRPWSKNDEDYRELQYELSKSVRMLHIRWMAMHNDIAQAHQHGTEEEHDALKRQVKQILDALVNLLLRYPVRIEELYTERGLLPMQVVQPGPSLEERIVQLKDAQRDDLPEAYRRPPIDLRDPQLEGILQKSLTV